MPFAKWNKIETSYSVFFTTSLQLSSARLNLCFFPFFCFKMFNANLSLLSVFVLFCFVMLVLFFFCLLPVRYYEFWFLQFLVFIHNFSFCYHASWTHVQKLTTTTLRRFSTFALLLCCGRAVRGFRPFHV